MREGGGEGGRREGGREVREGGSKGGEEGGREGGEGGRREGGCMYTFTVQAYWYDHTALKSLTLIILQM